MTLEEFRADFINDIEAESLSESEYPTDLFIDNVKDILANDFNVLDDLNRAYIDYKATSSKYKSMHLDAGSLERSVNTVNLLFADYSPKPMEEINNEFINQKINLLLGFFINAFKGYFANSADSDEVTQLARDILRYQDDIKNVHVILATTNKKSNRVKTTFELKPIQIGTKTFNLDFTLLDIDNIYQTKLAGFKKDDIIINTSDFGLNGIPCIKADVKSDDYDSYLAVVPGKFLSDIYIKYSSQLLESNVRSFLNTRGEVNKEILNTILNNKSRFFAYNNGIATTADSIETSLTNDGLVITGFKNLQIINGGQTTASLASAVIKKNADLSGIFVQMKLSIIKNESQREDLIRLIAKYANKQNKVTSSDLNSNHPFYKRIEDFSRRIKAPLLSNSTFQTSWFFERARGQYDQAKMQLKTKKEVDTFDLVNPKAQKFSKPDLAKFINCAEGKPYNVVWGAEVNLTKFQVDMEKSWDKSDTQFNEVYYKDLIAKAIIYKTIHKIISEQDWYLENRAYCAELTAYTFSKFVYEAEKVGKYINYKRIWELQALPNPLVEDLKIIAKICFDDFYSPQRPITNIREYAKRQVCWDAVKNSSFSFSYNANSLLIDKEEVKAQVRMAAQGQRENNHVTNEIDIFNKGILYWDNVKKVGSQLNELTPHEYDLCDVAIKYIKQIYKTLSSKQVRELAELMKKMAKYIQ